MSQWEKPDKLMRCQSSMPQDVSRPGTLYNDAVLLHKDAVFLSHGDTLLIHECGMCYLRHYNHEKLNMT